MATAETAQFVIGAEVSCSDGACGEVRRVVVAPVAEAVTHLVVGPEHPRGLGRLVPPFPWERWRSAAANLGT